MFLINSFKNLWLKICREIGFLFGKRKMENNIIVNNNCWLACFDILGFKEKILAFENTYGVGKLDRFANVIYKEILDALQYARKEFQGSVYACWASDTFVFYTPDDSHTSFTLISAAAIHFLCRMIRHSPRYMPRGALGTGQFYADRQNNVFLGSALIDAYEYAEKQNWIGFVVTPSAEEKIVDIHPQPQNLLDKYARDNVPVKKKQLKNGIKCIVEDTEMLYAAKIQSYPAIKDFFQPRHKGTPREEWVKKYENTWKFFEKHP